MHHSLQRHGSVAPCDREGGGRNTAEPSSAGCALFAIKVGPHEATQYSTIDAARCCHRRYAETSCKVDVQSTFSAQAGIIPLAIKGNHHKSSLRMKDFISWWPLSEKAQISLDARNVKGLLVLTALREGAQGKCIRGENPSPLGLSSHLVSEQSADAMALILTLKQDYLTILFCNSGVSASSVSLNK
ncbi:uncharacterized protein BO97DRAFT_415456 [Aspergillus homomorphus CBS 101889]|uniref:Uncharacterized protein n=1 Tax=Aspergillus homomorphus (strain CBS 101889) TaxID=1450537 RepID=A0A395HSN1_ASPHC|nr:hypothetical protein BO97DRAFT_415456 [Aspergillus homomorphus CBS 101889]RAL10952.1 hypothetical protein BO97DRAFT_415456 [Aspergillus homomorphus CBS 101889]